MSQANNLYREDPKLHFIALICMELKEILAFKELNSRHPLKGPETFDITR